MKTCRVFIPVFALNLIALNAAFAQRAVPPPPKPADSGPSLAVTMQFIQDKLNSIGKVNYAAYYHDNIAGTDWANQFNTEATNVVADPAACRITFHFKIIKDGAVTEDVDAWIPLHDVQDIVVTTGEQDQHEVDTAAGHPSYHARYDPAVFVLLVHRKDNGLNGLNFTDQDMANRVAKAMVHAVELCGGGNKEPF